MEIMLAPVSWGCFKVWKQWACEVLNNYYLLLLIGIITAIITIPTRDEKSRLREGVQKDITQNTTMFYILIKSTERQGGSWPRYKVTM